MNDNKKRNNISSHLSSIMLLTAVMVAAAIWMKKDRFENKAEDEDVADLMQNKLDRLVQQERYEEAAILRDKIAELRDK